MAESKVAVVGAIAANVAIAVMKFIGAAASGSSAMLSEGIHSTVDTANDLLLLVGMRLADRPADEKHPFGYGKELYFWSLIVAVLILGAGGGVSVYEGIMRILHPAPLEDAGWSYAILGGSFLFEGTSLAIALRQFHRTIEGDSFWRSLATTKDPSISTVLAEDSAALAGLLVAAFGLWGSRHWQLSWIDAAASIVIGLLLCAVASLLILQSRRLLVGESVDRETAEQIRAIAQKEPTVHRAGWPLTMHLGPDDVLLALDVEFRDGVTADEVAQSVDRIERAVRENVSEVRRIYIESRQVEPADARPLPAAG